MKFAHQDPRFCSCCEGLAALTPHDILNRPGLAAINYRVAVFASLRQAMLEAIAREPGLAAFTTRASDDMAISVLEAFAAVGDILTFYSERLANELYLRTARDRDSLLRLAHLTGYRLRPGLAATVDLAFQLDEGSAVLLRRGLKTMSVPLADEVPVFFETLEDLDADAALNQADIFGLPVLFNGYQTGRNRAPVDALPDGLSVSDRLLIWGLDRIEDKRLEAITGARGGTFVTFEPPIQGDGWSGETARAAKLLRRLRFFGNNAADTFQSYVADETLSPMQRWQSFSVSHGLAGYSGGLPLDRNYDDLSQGDALLIDAGPGTAPRLRTAIVAATEEVSVTHANVTETVTQIDLRETLRGQPVAAGGRRYFARNGAGTVIQMDRGAGTSSWDMISALSTSDLSVAWHAPGRWDLFRRGRDGDLVEHRLFDDLPGSVTADHGGILTSPPVALASSGGVTRVFVRGPDLGLWVRQTAPVAVAWQSLGGILTSLPTAVESAPGVLQVFVRGLDRGLWRRILNGGAWSEWERLRGTLATEPVAASNVPGTVEVAALDDDGRLIHRREDGSGWSEWEVLGGRLEGRPALVPGPGRLDVFATGCDGMLRHIARIGKTWGTFRTLDGQLASPPSAVRSAGRLDVVARGRDGTLMERSWVGTWQSWHSLGDGTAAITDRRRARIYQISPDDILFREFDYPELAEGGTVAMKLSPDQDAARLSELLKGRPVQIHSGDLTHRTEIRDAVPFSPELGALPDHIRLGLSNPLPEPIEAGTLFGNIAPASHGETQQVEILPSGASTEPLKTVTLGRAPLTYLPDPYRAEGRPEIDLRVGGVRWNIANSLFGRAPDDQVFTLRETNNGETEVTFGTGRIGARPIGGPLDIEAVYRIGSGLSGRIKGGQLSVLLEKPPGLKSVTNLKDAAAAADPEKAENARQNVPNQLRAFGRIVSLDDFVSVALATGLVAKAHVTWAWQALERAVHLSVAGPGGLVLTTDELTILHELLDGVRLSHRRLTIGGIMMIPLVVSARIVPATNTSKDNALASARAALNALFAFETQETGRAVHSSAVYAALHDAPGVAAADVDVFNVKDFADLTPGDLALRTVTEGLLQPQVRIYPARPTPQNPSQVDAFVKRAYPDGLPSILPAEQAFIERPDEDITLSITGAL
jgi:hypothetical protein